MPRCRPNDPSMLDCCAHVFCFECLLRWLSIGGPTCPLCKVTVALPARPPRPSRTSQQTFTSVVHDMHSGEFQKSTVEELRSVGCAGAVPSSGSVWVNKHALTADHWRRRRVYRHKTLALPYERAAQFVKPPSAYVRGGKGDKGRAAESEIARVTPWLERELQALLEERCVCVWRRPRGPHAH